METLAEVVSRIYANTKPESGCLVTTMARQTNGRAVIHPHGWQKKQHLSHRLIAQYYLGPCPGGKEVMHMCGRGHKGCVTASHLRYATHKENMEHAAKQKRWDGYKAANRSLTDDQVREIRKRSSLGEGRRSIARSLNVDKWAVQRVVAGQTYKEVA